MQASPGEWFESGQKPDVLLGRSAAVLGGLAVYLS